MRCLSVRTLVLAGALVASGGAVTEAQSIAQTTTSPSSSATTPAPPPTAPPATAPSAPAPAPATTAQSATAAAAAAPAEAVKPSADLLKKARQGGFHMRVRNGKTMYCKEDAQLGTRFVTERCMDENQLVETLEAQQRQRDQLNQAICTGGGSCGGSK
jgi:pyruvate/2-oxoglutarate dehydrogenase complex dihydrolipoamide acyltransferase (E2) component